MIRDTHFLYKTIYKNNVRFQILFSCLKNNHFQKILSYTSIVVSLLRIVKLLSLHHSKMLYPKILTFFSIML